MQLADNAWQQGSPKWYACSNHTGAAASPIFHERTQPGPHVWARAHALVSTHNLCEVSCTSDGAAIAVPVGLTVPISDGISEAPVALQNTAKHTMCQECFSDHTLSQQ